MDHIKVLLVEDDEDDYILTRRLLATIYGERLEVEWANSYDAARAAMARGGHDVCLLDYRLGAGDGLALLREAAGGYAAPIIFMTGQGDREVDMEAMRAGAADYLVKGQADVGLLERSIRYAIQQKRSEAERLELIREQAARKEAEESNRIKDEFLATVSHELRTPLNAMLGWVHLLRQGNLSTEQSARALETIERSARAQHKLIEDLLDLSRVITGKLRIEVREILLAPVIEAAVEAARPGAVAKEITLGTDFESREVKVCGDPDRLQQVVWNLVSNAVKFTPKGGRVEVALRPSGSHAEVTVSDTGEGIAPAFLPYVFDRFRQQDSSTTRRHGGLGLGLAIVRHLVELHGGTVRAESAGVGQGATFVVRLPLVGRGVALSDAAGRSVTQHGGDAAALPLRDVRALVVDDEDDSLDLACEILAQAGAEIRTARLAVEALGVLDRWQPDVIVCDIGMPGDDGYSLLRKVRARPAEKGGETPAIALTAYARSEDEQRSLDAGFQLHLAKPVEPQVLVASVARLSGREAG
jgi:signal transduction histidine kinase